MTNATIWDSLYKADRNVAIAPYTEVFSFLVRCFGRSAKGKRLLEIGCGVGNNLIFARWALGFDVFGIDQSETAIRLTRERFEEHSQHFSHVGVGSAESLDFDDGYFDVIIDRAAIQHNVLEDSRRIVSEVHRVLKPDGLFYSSLTSDSHHLFGQGEWLGGGTSLMKDLTVFGIFSREVRFWSYSRVLTS